MVPCHAVPVMPTDQGKRWSTFLKHTTYALSVERNNELMHTTYAARNVKHVCTYLQQHWDLCSYTAAGP